MTIQSVLLEQRFVVPSIDYAETMAFCVHEFLQQNSCRIKHIRAQHVVARMYGYRNWKQLKANIVPGQKPGPLSRDLSGIQNRARLARCLKILFVNRVPMKVGERLLEVVAPMDTLNVVLPLRWKQDDHGVWNTSTAPEFAYAIQKTEHGEKGIRYRACGLGDKVLEGEIFEGESVYAARAKVDAAWRRYVIARRKAVRLAA